MLSFFIVSAMAPGYAAGDDKPLSPFGIGSCYVNNRSVNDNSRWVPQMASIGLTAFRTPHCDWGALEPRPGEWDWKPLDEQMNYLDKHGFTFGCLVIGNPGWNKADKPGHLPVNNLKGWSNYVTELAKHVKGRTTRLEIWNEPPNFTGKDQTPADYAKIVVAAYDAAKAVDSKFKIGLAAKSVHINYLEQVIRAGAKDHFDFIVLHPYEVLDGVADNTGSDAVYFNIKRTVQRMLAAVNPAKKDVPIIFTELGVDSKKGLAAQSNALIKAYVLGIAQGVECIQWFEGRDGDSGPMGLLDGEGKPRPAYGSLGMLVQYLGKYPRYLGWTKLGPKRLEATTPGQDVTAFAFQVADVITLAAWGSPGSTTTVIFDNKVRVVDPTGRTVKYSASFSIGVDPVFILGAPESVIEAAKANHGKPVDWGGDYTKAKEVSISWGETTLEKGLHTRSASNIAKAVVAYGGSARAGDVPGGGAFIVDPGFLCYDSEPIEIEVEVRRNPANVNAGFKLVYESPSGFKTAGNWYTIPDNKEWHTAKWKIDDPQFVNYWGFNFLLESDGNEYNKYLIRKATVRKVGN